MYWQMKETVIKNCNVFRVDFYMYLQALERLTRLYCLKIKFM